MTQLMIDAGPLKTEVNEFLRIVPAVSPSTFGRIAVGDPTFTHRLASQDTVRASTAERVRDYMVQFLDGERDQKRVDLLFKIMQAKKDLVDSAPVTPPAKAADAEPVKPGSPAAKLLDAIAIYLEGNPNVTEADIGRHALKHGGFVGLLRKRGTLNQSTATKVLKWMMDNPNGPKVEEEPVAPPPPPPSSVSHRPVVAEVTKLSPVPKAQTPIQKPVREPQEPLSGSPAGLGARFQEIAMEDSVSDAVRVVQTAWPKTWRRICQMARDRNMRPVSLMIEILEGAV